MRQVLSGAIVGAVAFWLAEALLAAQQPNPPQSSTAAVCVEATNAADLRIWDTFVTSSARSGALRVRSVERDPALPSRTVERFEQFYQGVRIWGSDIVRDSEGGVALSIFGILAPDLALSVDPSLTLAAARDTLSKLVTPDPLLLTSPELVIVGLDGSGYRLAYTAVVSGGDNVIRAFIDAQTGVELMRYSEIEAQQEAVGTGIGVLGDRKKLSVEAISGT
jgi:Zn-dependent metalloprotease